MIKQLVSIEELFNDFNRVLEQFRSINSNPDKFPPRSFYLTHSPYTANDYLKHFEGYTAFVNAFRKENNYVLPSDTDSDLNPYIIGENDEEFMDPEEVQSILTAKKQLARQQLELKTLRKLLKEDISIDNQQDKFNSIIERLENIKFTPIKLEKKQQSKKSEYNKSTLLLHISDAHLGEVVKFDNQVVYNTEIGTQRIKDTFNRVIQKVKDGNYNKVHVLINGDMISGDIHDELQRTNDMLTTESIIDCAQLLTGCLIELYNNIPGKEKLTVDIMIGNHPRTRPGKPYNKEKVHDNFEWLLGKIIQGYMKEYKDIEINVPDSSWYIRNIQGVKFLETHGDIFRGGSSGINTLPFSTFCSTAPKLSALLDDLYSLGFNENVCGSFDSILIGHYHKVAIVPLQNRGFIYVNGAIKGEDEYARYNIVSAASVEQMLLEIGDNKVKSITYV